MSPREFPYEFDIAETAPDRYTIRARYLRDGAVVGEFEVWREGARMVFGDIWVKPEHRRRGLAWGMLHLALRLAVERGCRVAAFWDIVNPVWERAVMRYGFTILPRTGDIGKVL